MVLSFEGRFQHRMKVCLDGLKRLGLSLNHRLQHTLKLRSTRERMTRDIGTSARFS